MYQCTIIVKELQVNALIGLLPEEQNVAQPLLVSVEAILKRKPADLSESLNYAEVVQYIENLAQQHTLLVEEFGETVGRYCLQNNFVQSVTVSVRKTAILPQTRGVGCSIYMEQP